MDDSTALALPPELLEKWGRVLNEDTARLRSPVEYVALEAAKWGYQQALKAGAHD